MKRTQRIIWSDNGTLIDISRELNDFRSDSKVLPIVALQDAIYIGTELPFNHKYVEVSVANDVASVVSVAIWNGNEWVAAVDLVDETSVGGATLATSGRISFSPDIDKSNWSREQDSTDIPALAGTRIFNLYWVRLTFSADLKATTALSYIGERFADDNGLFDIYPDLRSATLMTSYQPGKTDWKQQSFIAAEAIVRDLRAKSIIVRPEQILRGELYQDASVHKAAQIIYMGINATAYNEKIKLITDRYNASLDVNYNEVDQNADGMASPTEIRSSLRFMTR